MHLIGGRFVLLWALVCALAFVSVARACTVFFVPTSAGPLFARNFDFPAHSAYLTRNGRGVAKASFVPPPMTPFQWKSLYGNVTLNQAGFEFPTEGMNEAGLTIAALVWDGAGVPKSATTPALNQLQWIQYQLDTQRTVRDVIATLPKVPVVEVAFALHFAVCDPTECAVVEWIDGKPRAFVGAELPVPALANDGYGNSCRALSGAAVSNASSMDLLLGSGARFRGAAEAAESAKKLGAAGLLAHAFRGLDAVSQGMFTQWQTVFDPAGLSFDVRRGLRRPTASVRLSGLDWDEHRPGWIDLDAAAQIGGPTDGDFSFVLPPQYCSEIIASLGSVRASVDPRLLAAIPGYVHRLHPSSRPAPTGR